MVKAFFLHVVHALFVRLPNLNVRTGHRLTTQALDGAFHKTRRANGAIANVITTSLALMILVMKLRYR